MALLIVLALAGAALANLKEETSASHSGRVIAMDQSCPDLHMDEGVVIALVTNAGLKWQDVTAGGRLHSATEAGMKDFFAVYGKSRVDACALGYVLYGPEGKNVPGMIVRK